MTKSVERSAVRLSAASLWRTQEAAYRRAGPAAWLGDKALPSYISSSALLAEVYGKLIAAFLRDTAGTAIHLNRDEPVYVIELGAGTGRLGYLLGKELQRRLTPLDCRWCYVLTDIADTIHFWRRQPQLQSFVQAGLLDFASFDCLKDDTLTLLHSGQIIRPGKLTNPLIVIANYVFDSLPHDLFRINQGRLEEGRVFIPVPTEPTMDVSPARLWHCEYARIAVPAAYPGDPMLAALLDEYRRQLGSVSFLIPVGAIEALRRLSRWANGRMFFLAGDKGYTQLEHLVRFGDPPQPVQHQHVVSFAVNFHALQRHLQRLGGTTWLPAEPQPSFVVMAGVLGTPPDRLMATSATYADVVDGFPIGDHLPFLTQGVPAGAQLDYLIGLLQVCRFDPEVMIRHAGAFAGSRTPPNSAILDRLVVALRRVWENFYPVGSEDARVPQCMAQLLFAHGKYREAVPYYRHSLMMSAGIQEGKVLLQMALCHRALGEFQQAEKCLVDAAQKDPGDPGAAGLLAQVRSLTAGSP